MFLCANKSIVINSGSNEKLSLDTRTNLEPNKTASEIVCLGLCSMVIARMKQTKDSNEFFNKVESVS